MLRIMATLGLGDNEGRSGGGGGNEENNRPNNRRAGIPSSSSSDSDMEFEDSIDELDISMMIGPTDASNTELFAQLSGGTVIQRVDLEPEIAHENKKNIVKTVQGQAEIIKNWDLKSRSRDGQETWTLLNGEPLNVCSRLHNAHWRSRVSSMMTRGFVPPKYYPSGTARAGFSGGSCTVGETSGSYSPRNHSIRVGGPGPAQRQQMPFLNLPDAMMPSFLQTPVSPDANKDDNDMYSSTAYDSESDSDVPPILENMTFIVRGEGNGADNHEPRPQSAPIGSVTNQGILGLLEISDNDIDSSSEDEHVPPQMGEGPSSRSSSSAGFDSEDEELVPETESSDDDGGSGGTSLESIYGGSESERDTPSPSFEELSDSEANEEMQKILRELKEIGERQDEEARLREEKLLKEIAEEELEKGEGPAENPEPEQEQKKKKKVYPCVRCDDNLVLKKKYFWYKHIIKNHNKWERRANEDVLYKCIYCPKMFGQKRNRNNHQLVHDSKVKSTVRALTAQVQEEMRIAAEKKMNEAEKKEADDLEEELEAEKNQDNFARVG